MAGLGDDVMDRDTSQEVNDRDMYREGHGATEGATAGHKFEKGGGKSEVGKGETKETRQEQRRDGQGGEGEVGDGESEGESEEGEKECGFESGYSDFVLGLPAPHMAL